MEVRAVCSSICFAKYLRAPAMYKTFGRLLLERGRFMNKNYCKTQCINVLFILFFVFPKLYNCTFFERNYLSNVNRKDNYLTTAELHRRFFPWKYPRFSELFLDDAFQSYLNREKHFLRWLCIQKYCRNWCHFDIFIMISRHTAWIKHSETVAPKASMKKLFLKIL